MELSLGFSPCPNDTFIFDALVNKKIDTGGIDFTVSLEDVETLNQWAKEGKLSVTKLSFPALFQSLEHYVLLNTGSAVGMGVGPLLISDAKHDFSTDDINQSSIALPGVNTTANLLFSYAYPDAQDKKFMPFSAIETALVNKEVDLGVIIHENRFTYQQKGLFKVKDLGTHWQEQMELPVPLGGIAIHQSIKRNVAIKVNELILASLQYARANYPAISDYTRQHAQEMSDDIMRQHIDLYVNDYSLDLGADGRNAIEELHSVYLELNNQEADDEDILFL